MGHVVIELTNRCNLSCLHCFSGRHGGRDELPLSIFDRILHSARDSGFDRFSFTGGDPTLHSQFAEVCRRTAQAGYRFGFVTNGWNFPSIAAKLLPYREALSGLTFSLDGATEGTHDEIRGSGSYRRVLRAMCVAFGLRLPFAVNTVISAKNRHELREVIAIAARLGAAALRFGQLMPSPQTSRLGYDLSPDDWKAVLGEIRQWAGTADIPVALAPGFYTHDPFPCAPLRMEEVNVDCRGNLTKCCHLSGWPGQGDFGGNLAEVSFGEALEALRSLNQEFCGHKQKKWADGRMAEADFFPCWYCSVQMKRMEWLRSIPGHPWIEALGEDYYADGNNPNGPSSGGRLYNIAGWRGGAVAPAREDVLHVKRNGVADLAADREAQVDQRNRRQPGGELQRHP